MYPRQARRAILDYALFRVDDAPLATFARQLEIVLGECNVRS